MSDHILERELFDVAIDDCVVPFAIDALDIRGRLIRLGAASDAIISGHGFAPVLARLASEALALTALLGSSLKTEGRFILQTQSSGPVSLLVVDYTLPDRLRACARFDPAAIEQLGADADSAALLGQGHLAMTIDQGASGNRYQGVVALDDGGLEAAAHAYFRQSEQIPTKIRIAGGELVGTGDKPSIWRAGGMMVQHFPKGGAKIRDLDPGDAPAGHVVADDDDDHWIAAASLVDTLEDHELTDPSLAPGTVLHRLFNEYDTVVFDPITLQAACSCSQASVTAMLASFPPEDRGDVNARGFVEVTCDFCNTTYEIDPADAERLAQQRVGNA